jgi:hypothetical protein
VNKLCKLLNFSLAEILTILAEVLLIGLLQLIFSYGSVIFLGLIYVVARCHPLSRKLISKMVD